MATKLYNPAVDWLRFLSILAVILIHTTTRTLELTHYQLDQTLWTLFLHQITRFAVPLFFLISGFVLELNYDHELSYWSYLKKRLSKIFIPYVFWSAIYFYFIYVNHGPDFFSALIYGSASHQLYFIPAILVFYLIFPLFHWLYRFLMNRWVLLILGALELWLLYADYYLHSLRFFYPLGVAAYNYFIFILGMFFSHHHGQIISFVKKRLKLLMFLVIFLAGYIFVVSRGLYFKTYDIGYFYSNWRPQILPYTLGLAAVLYYYFSQIKFRPAVIKALSGLSFLVFFLHLIVMEKIYLLIGIPLHPGLWFDPLFFLLTALISFGLAWLIHKLPLVSKITG